MVKLENDRTGGHMNFIYHDMRLQLASCSNPRKDYRPLHKPSIMPLLKDQITKIEYLPPARVCVGEKVLYLALLLLQICVS